jgi:hypothetical protein
VAKSVGGSDARVSGKDVFRALGAIKRLVLTNLGLSHALGRNIRYTMFMGADIAEGLTESAKRNRRMLNIIGLGYEDDQRVTVGCARVPSESDVVLIDEHRARETELLDAF